MSAPDLPVGVGPDLPDRLRPVLASLPDDFSITTGGPVVVVDGRRRDWPTALAAALTPARAVVLHEPCVPDGDGPPPRDLVHRAVTAGVPVVVDRRWSQASAVAAVARAVPGDAGPGSLAVLLVEDDPERRCLDGLLDGLGLARASGHPVTVLDRVDLHPGSWSVTGTATGEVVVHLQGVLSTAAAVAEVSVAHASTRTSVRVPDPSSAAPAHVRSVDAAGEHLLPVEHESAARQVWRRLRRQLDATDLDPGAELSALVDDLGVLDDLVVLDDVTLLDDPT